MISPIENTRFSQGHLAVLDENKTPAEDVTVNIMHVRK